MHFNQHKCSVYRKVRIDTRWSGTLQHPRHSMLSPVDSISAVHTLDWTFSSVFLIHHWQLFFLYWSRNCSCFRCCKFLFHIESRADLFERFGSASRPNWCTICVSKGCRGWICKGFLMWHWPQQHVHHAHSFSSALHHGIGSYKLKDAGRPHYVLPVFEFDRDDRVSYICIYLPALAKIGGQEAQSRCAHTW